MPPLSLYRQKLIFASVFLPLVFFVSIYHATAPTIQFCDLPTHLPRAMPLADYSPLFCLDYGGLRQATYTLSVSLVDTDTKQCASSRWCERRLLLDTTSGAQPYGRILLAEPMDVTDGVNLSWVAQLFLDEQLLVRIEQPATGVMGAPPLLATTHELVGKACQPIDFTVTTVAASVDTFDWVVYGLPPGATFDTHSGVFAWPCPLSGSYSEIVVTARQRSAPWLSDAERIAIYVDMPVPELRFSAATLATGEGGVAVPMVERQGDTLGIVTVNCLVHGGSAAAGSDFQVVVQTLVFTRGEIRKPCPVPLRRDAEVEASETFSVNLANPFGAMLGALSSTTVRIVDDDTPAISGRWEPLITLPTVPIHLHLLPTGDVLFWDTHDSSQQADGTPYLWDVATGEVRPVPLPELEGGPYDIFCGGHSFLADGRLLVTGGHRGIGIGDARAILFDPASESWTLLPAMGRGRWYPSNVTLATGDVLVLAGTDTGLLDTNRLPQVWQVNQHGWRDLTSALLGDLPAWPLFYPYLFLAPNGQVFNAGPQAMARYLDPNGAGSWTDVAASSQLYRDYGSAVLYDEGKVLIVGGNSSTGWPSASAEVIDLEAPTPAWRPVAPMSTGRRHHNATLLADGSVLVTGGTSLTGLDNPVGGVFYAEQWDPFTESWTVLASYEQYRGYHSTALLLPDGRLIIGGGGHPNAPGLSAEMRVELFSPPYLFRGDRPMITTAPIVVHYGEEFVVETADAATITRANWIRLGAVTHAFNQNQRINWLKVRSAEGKLLVTAPATATLAPPGHYMLFLINKEGVPSVAHIVQVVGA